MVTPLLSMAGRQTSAAAVNDILPFPRAGRAFVSPALTNSNNTATETIAGQTYIVTTSSHNTADRRGWKAFDNVATPDNYNSSWQSATTTGTLTIQFPQAVIAKSYDLYVPSAGNRPISWTFQGSNDATNFTTLHTGSTAPVSNTYVNYSVSANTTAYLYYRLNVTSGDAGFCIIEFRINAV